jgi:hypothetical protein
MKPLSSKRARTPGPSTAARPSADGCRRDKGGRRCRRGGGVRVGECLIFLRLRSCLWCVRVCVCRACAENEAQKRAGLG